MSGGFFKKQFLMRSLYEQICLTIADYYLAHGEEKMISVVIKFPSVYHSLSCLYNYFTLDGIVLLENIPEEQKQRYRDLTKGMFTNKGERMKAIRAIYVMELAVNDEEIKKANDIITERKSK